LKKKLLRILWPGGRWRWFLRALLLMPFFMVFSVELTSQSWFCNSCHIMNPYYATWKSGTHHHAECVQCHIPPGMSNFVSAKLNGAGQVVDDLLDRTNSKPSAFVSDTSCTRSGCHNMEALKAKPRIEKKFFFKHGDHLGLSYSGIDIHCTTCHSHIKGDKHFEVNTNACITCHLGAPDPAPKKTTVQLAMLASTDPKLPEGTVTVAPTKEKHPPKDCKSCHNAPDHEIEYRGMKVNHAEYLSFGARCESCHNAVTEKPKPVRDDQCFNCHEFGLEKLGSVAETHRIHSTSKHKTDCMNCHGITNHGPKAQSMGLDKIDCQGCHTDQHAIQQNTYKLSSELIHMPDGTPAVSPMFMSHVSCTGCHIKARPVSLKPETGATVKAAAAEACDKCHQAGLGEKMVPLWQKNTHALFDIVSHEMPATVQTLDPKARQLVNEAKGLLDVVRLDGSWGVHNPRYTQRLLEDARKKLQDAKPVSTPVAK
jgi:nitrate/TMAO reductase-like tetraheme cytochrome c subunit